MASKIFFSFFAELIFLFISGTGVFGCWLFCSGNEYVQASLEYC